MNITDFLEKYEPIASCDVFENQFSSTGKKTCKFCGQSSDETTFKTKPHVIPELLGKNNFTSNEECDSCNELFGRFESSFANYISPYQTLIGQRTKNKIPKFQSRKEGREQSTTIVNNAGGPNINFGRNLSDFVYDYENNILSIKLKKKKFNPIHVYKGLVKIGMSLCPAKEIANYQKTLKWLRMDEENLGQRMVYDIPLTLFRTRFSSKHFSKPSATLYKRVSDFTSNIYRPNLCLVVNSGILVFQIFIPFCKETENIDLTKFSFEPTIFPAFIFDLKFPAGQKEMKIDIADLPIKEYDMSHYPQVEKDEWVSFKYKELKRNE